MLDSRKKILTTRYWMQISRLILFLVASILYPVTSIFYLSSCNRPVDKQTLTTYLNDPDNGLKKEITSGAYKVALTYRPTDLLVEQELGTKATKEEQEKKKQEYSRYHYFILNMSLGDKDVLYQGSGSQQQFSTSLSRLNFELSNYIYARTDGKDTLYLADYYVPNLYGMGGSTQILLAFPNEAEKQYQEMEIHLQELGFGIGNQKFVFKKKDFDNIPSLQTTNPSLPSSIQYLVSNNIHPASSIQHPVSSFAYLVSNHISSLSSSIQHLASCKQQLLSLYSLITIR